MLDWRIRLNMSKIDEKCKLYLISPPHFELEDFKVKLLEAFSGGEVSVFQLRMKSQDENGKYIAQPDWGEVEEVAKHLIPICHTNNCIFILNDNPELARKVGADGVHVGSDDATVLAAREIMGEGKYIGASCYASRDLAYRAAEQGADYVAFGAFYETLTKEPKGRPEVDLLEFWSTYTNLPVVAIGGIKTSNASPLIGAGADFIAVVTGVWDYDKGVKEAVFEFNQLF